MPDKSSEAIGIIGSGPIGQGLATLWAQAGYTVQLGARSPESARRVSVLPSVRVVSFEEAARHKVVVLAVKHSAAPGRGRSSRAAPQGGDGRRRDERGWYTGGADRLHAAGGAH